VGTAGSDRGAGVEPLRRERRGAAGGANAREGERAQPGAGAGSEGGASVGPLREEKRARPGVEVS
jgi:hypothetical protein